MSKTEMLCENCANKQGGHYDGRRIIGTIGRCSDCGKPADLLRKEDYVWPGSKEALE